jgi:hypothetical protein
MGDPAQPGGHHVTEPTPTPDAPAVDPPGPDLDALVTTQLAEAHHAAVAAIDALPGLGEAQRGQMRAAAHARAQQGLPEPLPTVRDDPALTNARAHVAAYVEAEAGIRADNRISELERAERLHRAHKELDAQLLHQWRDLTARRAARLAAVEKVTLPFGPGPDIEQASPADRTVLLAAWRDAYEKATSARHADRREQLAASARWGDHVAVRAILTAMDHSGDHVAVAEWAKTHRPHLVNIIRERVDLRTKLAGHDRSVDSAWTAQAFRLPTPPVTDHELRRLREDDMRARGIHITNALPYDPRTGKAY